MAVEERATRLNGFGLEQFEETGEAVKRQAEAGKLTWRGRVRWDGGFGVDARTGTIEQLGERMPRRFTLRGDHPPERLDQNTGPTAVEALLAALGACVAGTLSRARDRTRPHATARGGELEELELDVEGGIDLNGFLHLALTRQRHEPGRGRQLDRACPVGASDPGGARGSRAAALPGPRTR